MPAVPESRAPAVERSAVRSRRRDPHRVLREVQPLNWGRAALCGVLGAFFLSCLVLTVAGMGYVDFTIENYLGELLYASAAWHSPYRAWIVGFLGNLALGAVFGVGYAAGFEYFFRRADVRVGLGMGLLHLIVAALTVFPAFNIVHEFMADPSHPGTGPYAGFGLLGYGLSPDLTAALACGHLLFGVIMGGLYGPVREERVRLSQFEPRTLGDGEGDDTLADLEPGEKHWQIAS